MGSHLERMQAIAQRHGAALVIAHHWNKTGEGRGAKRMTGVGPGRAGSSSRRWWCRGPPTRSRSPRRRCWSWTSWATRSPSPPSASGAGCGSTTPTTWARPCTTRWPRSTATTSRPTLSWTDCARLPCAYLECFAEPTTPPLSARSGRRARLGGTAQGPDDPGRARRHIPSGTGVRGPGGGRYGVPMACAIAAQSEERTSVEPEEDESAF